MTTIRLYALIGLALVCGFQASMSIAFAPTSRCQRPDATLRISKLYQQNGRLPIRSLNALNSSADPDMPPDEAVTKNDLGGGPSMSLPTSSAQDGGPSMSLPKSSAQQQQPEIPAAYVPPPPTPTRNSPSAVRQQSMDPLMASLTRDNSDTSPDQPTQNVPFFGEIPADGTLLLLAPALVFGILGFVYSIVIAFNSSDQIVNSLTQTAVNKNNQVYDKNVCRGLCSSQQEDIEGLRNFMEAITRNAREGK